MQKQLRWPELLNVNAERAGSRGGHERAQLVTVMTRVVLAFAGRLLPPARLERGWSERQRTPVMKLLSNFCAMRWGKRVRGMLRNTGKTESKEWAAGTHWIDRN